MSSASATTGSSTHRYGSGLSFKDPDGNALELFAPPFDSSGRGPR